MPVCCFVVCGQFLLACVLYTCTPYTSRLYATVEACKHITRKGLLCAMPGVSYDSKEDDCNPQEG